MLKEIESLTNKDFTKVDEIKYDTKMGFTTENNRVSGIGLYECELTTLPESIGQLQSLQTLNLNSNQLTTLPESIGQLQSLQTLSLYINKLSTLPESVTHLKSLQTLRLNDNQLSTLPESISNFKSLQTLDLYNNKLTTLPESLGQLSSLKELHLINNQLTTLPESIGQLSSLKELYLSSNKLTTLPESIGQLKTLTYLDLGNTQLTTLPESIGQLSSLQTLCLNDNQLTTLPESVTQLTSLQKLYLGNTQLTTLPESLWRLKNLTRLDLKKNKWAGEWSGIEKESASRVVELCRQRTPISIVVNYSQKDRDQHIINALTQYLKKCREIQELFASGNQKISEFQLLLFVATKNSVSDERCRQELKSAVSSGIPIVPIKGADLKWKDLSQIDLGADFNVSDQKGFEYDEKNLDQFCEELYKYIQQLKREINLLEPGERRIDEQWRNFKTIRERIFESDEFKANFRENIEQFRKIEEDLKNNRITVDEYMFEFFSNINNKKE